MNEYAKLPQVGKLTQKLPHKNKKLLSQISSQVIAKARNEIANGKSAPSEQEILQEIDKLYLQKEKKTKRLVNATGVVLHTNLGRAPISPELYDSAKDVICGYSDLEFDLDSGERGDRYSHVKTLCQNLFGCEDALIVNNNAAAVFLVLNTLAKGGESVVSRGELVEIGGSFRVPDVMSEAGTKLVEVGTTNKTRLSDYETAINENTKLLLKVHRSNFEIVGFEQSVKASELAKLASKHGLTSYYDLGAGYVGRLPASLSGTEPSIEQLIMDGVNLLSFSGDKLFASVQCGIILGDTNLISKIRKNQLLRMLRVDKITLNLLANSLEAYIAKDYAALPALECLHRSIDDLQNLAQKINQKLTSPLKTKHTTTYAGGGSLPNKAIASLALTVKGDADELLARFRKAGVIARIEDDELLLDMRSILHDDISPLAQAINLIQGEIK